MSRHRFKHFLRERNEFSANGEETLLSVSEYYGVKPRADAFDGDRSESRAESLEGYRIVKEGDLVMNYMLAWKGAYGLSAHHGITSPAYAVFDVDTTRVDRRFLHHRTRSKDMQVEFRAKSKGIIESRLRLYPDALLAMQVDLPDLLTQKRIAAFLDSETARIDELIAKKERLVEVLTDARFSAISRAVTVGLDEGQPLVDTNSKYIPQVPESWTVWRLKHLARAFGGITLGRKLDAEEQTVSTPYLRVANVQAGWLDLSDVAEIEATAKERKRYALKAGDILMNEGGDNDKLGRGAVWNAPFGPCITQNHVFFVRPKDTRFSEWISLATNARYARDFFYLHSNQSTNLASVSKTNLERFPVAIPPFEEMQSTLSALTARLDLMKQTTKATRTSIDRLREYRAALITAAVTGQIDVGSYGKSGTPSATLDRIEEEMH